MLISNENLRKRKYKIIIKTLILLFFSFLLAWLACQLIYDNKVNELKNIQPQKLLSTSALFNLAMLQAKSLNYVGLIIMDRRLLESTFLLSKPR